MSTSARAPTTFSSAPTSSLAPANCSSHASAQARAAIVTDENVARHHLPALEASLAAVGRHAGTIVMPPGEATKSFAELGRLSEALLALKLERGDVIVALGGGVIGDLAGFAASILRRGIRFVQIPTSLLAQVDSSVGGKTGINTPQGKNLIGAFHQPSLVLADTDALTTLPPREMRAGYAEVAKYGLLGDAPFFAWLERHWQSVFGNDPAILTEAIVVSVTAKARIVERDETETGDRMLLNLGHTFGHALEAWAGYSGRLLHGEAVAIGMTPSRPLLRAPRLVPRRHRRAHREPSPLGRPADPRRAHSRRRPSRAANAVRPHAAGQKSPGRPPHPHPAPRHRRRLRHPRYRCGEVASVPGA